MYTQRLLTGFLRRTVKEFKDKEPTGTLAFTAPEVILKQGYGRAIDWYVMILLFSNQCFMFYRMVVFMIGGR